MCVQQDVTLFQGYLNCKFSKGQCILKRETDYNTTLHKWYACSLFLDFFFPSFIKHAMNLQTLQNLHFGHGYLDIVYS